VRTCAREGINNIADARRVLADELIRYNSYQVHSVTGEIPDIRFYRAIDDKRSLFREFAVPSPFSSTKDIFALRAERTVNAYRKISINKLELFHLIRSQGFQRSGSGITENLLVSRP